MLDRIMNSRQTAFFSMIVFVMTFCFISDLDVMPREFDATNLPPQELYHNIRRGFVQSKRLHSQDCPPLWRSYVESCRPVNHNKDSNVVNFESVNYNKTTSPKYTTVTILNRKSIYNLCDVLVIKIEARNGLNQTKSYGGDFFRFKIYDPSPYSAAAEDDIIDFGNGTYLAFFTLRWTGKVKVEIKLVYPAELLPQMSLTLSGKAALNMTFTGNFVNGKHSEEVTCRYFEFPGPICNYSDANTHGPWFCEKPKNGNLKCEHWKFYQFGTNASILNSNLTPLSKFLLKRSNMVKIKNDCSIEVTDKDPPRGPPKVLPYCYLRGLPLGIHSSGHFFRNAWYPDHCRVADFNISIASGMNCLRNKTIVILGDSTSRQMYDYVKDIYHDYFKQLPLAEGIEDFQGPKELISTEYHANIKFQFHGLPIGSGRKLRPDAVELVANRLNSNRDGCDVVYIICVWAHFVPPGKVFYIERLLAIKRAVQAFLERCPGSKVIIKGANTRDYPALWVFVMTSEWNIVQHELSLRELFKDEKRVGFIDSLDITKVQPYSDNLHPARPIVKELVNRMLTYVCKV